MINPLSHYLTKDKKVYEFKIKLADVQIDNNLLDRIEHSLNAFQIASMSKPKTLPINDKSLDFPNAGPVEVTLIDVVLNYPCTDAQIRNALGTQGRLPMASIVVTPKNAPEEIMREEESEADKANKKYEPLLTKEIAKSNTDGQIKVGQQRVDSMLKELEARTYEYAGDTTKPAETTNDLPMGTTSPFNKTADRVKVK
jgi:hypothetical protein